jgi:hypothetical protein
MVWIGFIWRWRVKYQGSVSRVMKFIFKTWKIFLLAEKLLFSQEGPCAVG